MDTYKLIIFDVDGTLAANDATDLLPSVREWRNVHPDQSIALASNQGGVGLRYWMEENGFGDPSQYPTQDEVTKRLRAIARQMGANGQLYMCFAYQSKTSGKWSPTPPGCETLIEWNKRYRKPAPGMLEFAMREARVYPQETLMVGDSEEDEEAAKSAHCHFIKATQFFDRR